MTISNNFLGAGNSDFKNASESFKRLNPHLVGGLPATQPQPNRQQPTPRQDGRQENRARKVVVCLVGYRRRTLDDDNFVGACKHLRDAIAASLGLDDGDPCLRWEYGQHETRGAEGVMVKIEFGTENNNTQK